MDCNFCGRQGIWDRDQISHVNLCNFHTFSPCSSFEIDLSPYSSYHMEIKSESNMNQIISYFSACDLQPTIQF